jgi:hypothetical protein
MKSSSDSETNAAVQTAGRELIVSALQRNPLAAVATALIGPILGLFRRRRNAAATEVRKMKLESYTSSPVSPPPGRRRIRQPAKPGGRPVASRWHPGARPVRTRSPPGGHPVRTRTAPGAIGSSLAAGPERCRG